MIAAVNPAYRRRRPRKALQSQEKPLPFTVDDRVDLSGTRDKKTGGDCEPAPL